MYSVMMANLITRYVFLFLKVSSSVAMGTGASRTAPLMRPLTPSSVGPSLHQIEHQLLEAEVQLENYTSGLAATFEVMRCQAMSASLSPRPGTTHEGDASELHQDDCCDVVQSSCSDGSHDEQSSEGTRPRPSSSIARPSTRGSR